MEELFAFLNGIKPLSTALESRLRSLVFCKKYKAGDILLREGEICHNIFYIKKGVVRIYSLKNGKEITTWLLKEGDIFISIKSFFEQTKSDEFIQALEDLKVWGITYQQLEDVCGEFPEFHTHRDKIKTNYYLLSDERKSDMQSLTPEERYIKLLNKNPELIHRVPLTYIASYLNMSDRTLARIRKSISSKKSGKK